MKPVIIIALAFVLFVPISVYGASYDGTYNYWFTMHNDPGMNSARSVPGGFIVSNNNIFSSQSGYFSGSVSSGGSVNFSGGCPPSSIATAKYTGTLGSDGRGGGEYFCIYDGKRQGGEGQWSVTRIGGPQNGNNQRETGDTDQNTEEQRIGEDAKYTYNVLVESLKDCDLSNAKSVAQRLYDWGAQLEDLGSIQKGQFIMSQADIAWDAIIKLEKGIPTAIEDRFGDRINLSCPEGDQFANIQRGISNTADIIGWAIFVIVALGVLGGLYWTYKFVRSRF